MFLIHLCTCMCLNVYALCGPEGWGGGGGGVLACMFVRTCGNINFDSLP